MLKRRIAATVLVRDSIVVQSIGFSSYMPVGKPTIAVEFLDDWGIDEIILLDISASKLLKGPSYPMIRDAAIHCHVPLTVGGGVSSVEQVHELMQCGADKISFNQAALLRPKLIESTARKFGSQCVIVSVDIVKVNDNYRVYDYLRQEVQLSSPTELAKTLQELGAGEILINSVDRDGSQLGFDLELINEVCEAVDIPIICCGGAGRPEHFTEVFEKTRANAATAANYFHFTEHCVTTTKALVSERITVRHETHALYEKNTFDSAGRLLKNDESYLEELLYHKTEKEII